MFILWQQIYNEISQKKKLRNYYLFLIWQEWIPIFEANGEGHENLPNYDYTKFVRNPQNLLENNFLDVGMYANAMELYKADLKELRGQLKIKVVIHIAWHLEGGCF